MNLSQTFKSCIVSLKEGCELDCEDDNESLIELTKFKEVLDNLEIHVGDKDSDYISYKFIDFDKLKEGKLCINYE
jgi:cell wall assembly regulator SMI1